MRTACGMPARGRTGVDIAHSASVLVDGSGVVRWTFVTKNYRVRPTPAEECFVAATARLPHAN